MCVWVFIPKECDPLSSYGHGLTQINKRRQGVINNVLWLFVASESEFSTSGRDFVQNRRTRLTAESLEMCMCLKDHLDAHERRQHTTPLELPLDVEEGVFNDEVQMNEATQLTDQEIALDASSDGSFEEPPRDYMLSSGAEDDETQDGAGGSMSHGHGQYTYY
ncbi:hypothetical protein Tco_0134116 [Tanacetum coccineum]